MSETSVASARASVMVYDDAAKKWVPSGSSSGLSKVHLYHNTINNTFRVVGRKLQDHEVVINCSIIKSTKYNQATSTFHQWRDNRQVYGLNFSSREDADGFHAAISRAQEILTHQPPPPQNLNINSTPPRPPPSLAVIPQAGPTYQSVNHLDHSSHLSEEQHGWNNNPEIRPQNQYASSTITTQYASSNVASQYASTPASNCPYATTGNIVNNHSGGGPPNQLPLNSPNSFPSPNGGHHRSSSASNGVTTSAPPPPPPPPPPSGPSAPPPPPPPPPPGTGTTPGGYATMPRLHSSNPPPPPAPPPPSNLLATQIASAKLKKTHKGPEDRNSEQQSGALRPTLGHGNIAASMMDEMAKTLARRRAQAENTQNQNDESGGGGLERKRSWENHTNDHSPSKPPPESPKLGRRHTLASLGAADGGSDLVKANGTDLLDLEKLKQEILAEVKQEFTKMRQEIVEAIRTEFNRR